jgi:hypothetical protein
MKVYIAGPMRGIPMFNYPAFDAAAALWRSKGWEVINPAEIDRQEDGAAPTLETPVDVPPLPFSVYMRRDITALLTVDAIAFLPGWENSKGACVERVVAEALDLFLYDAMTGAVLDDQLFLNR